jgi:hypothetical protein
VGFAVLLEPVVALGALLACALCLLVLYGYKFTLGALLAGFAGILFNVASAIPLGLGGVFTDAGNAILGLDNTILNVLGTGVNATSYAWHRWAQWTAQSFTAIGEAERYVATETLRGFQTMRRAVIPNLIAAAVGPLGLAIDKAATHTGAVAKIAVALPAKIEKVYVKAAANVYPTKIEVEKIGKAALARAIAVAGGLAIPRLGQLERDLAAAQAKLGKIVRTLTPAGVIGLVAAAVAELGLSASKCSNVQKFNKGLCGMNPKWIEDLLLGAVAIFGSLSLVKLAEDYKLLFGDVATEARHFWRADVKGPGKDRAIGTSGL